MHHGINGRYPRCDIHTTFFINDSTADTTYAGQFTGGQTFYLRVRGMNDLGASAYSAIDTFTIMTPPAGQHSSRRRTMRKRHQRTA